jgi:hypothetical protein
MIICTVIAKDRRGESVAARRIRAESCVAAKEIARKMFDELGIKYEYVYEKWCENAESKFTIIPQLSNGDWLPAFQVEAETSTAAALIASVKLEEQGMDYKYIYVHIPPQPGESKYTERPDPYPEFQYGSENIAAKQIGGV